MTELELAGALREMYENAPYGEQVTMIHLFGIKYTAELANVSKQTILELAGMRPSYVTEIHKGIRLSRYVQVRDN